jgi:hypothetical protein
MSTVAWSGVVLDAIDSTAAATHRHCTDGSPPKRSFACQEIGLAHG